jgi:hypothetical protein
MQATLSQHWHTIQATLFPILEEELGLITQKHQQLVTTLDFARVETFIKYHHSYVGCPAKDRAAIARAFIAKSVYNLTTTRSLIDRLHCDPVTRRICGWERRSEIPSESTFSRAFAEFAETKLASNIQDNFVEEQHGGRVIGHISRDATEIKGREKVLIRSKKPKPEKNEKGRRKKGEEKPQPEPTRLMRQITMGIDALLADLPKHCDVGTKINSKGYKESWKGYKLHIDTADGDIPVSAILTSASLHDSQVAIPLSALTAQKIDNFFYELMDAAYDAQPIRSYIVENGRVPLIDYNHRSPKDERNFAPHEAVRYKERSSAERVNSNLKDNFGGRFVRVRGHSKVLSHLMFGLLALTISQTLRLIT